MAIQERSSAAAWWSKLRGRGPLLRAVVIGLRESGKSRFFADLAADPANDLVLWDAVRMARVSSKYEVWSDLCKALGFSPPSTGDLPTEHLDVELQCSERRITLVVDNWDLAIDGKDRGPAVPEDCYEVLDTLSRFCIDQGRDRERRGYLGLVLLTSLPDPGDLRQFATLAQRPSFERLSQVIVRAFTAEPFPTLSRAEAEELLVAEERLPLDEARAVAAVCGGWPRLLREAASVVRERTGPLRKALDEVGELELPRLLDSSLYTWLRRRSEVQNWLNRHPEFPREPAEYLERRLADGAAPSKFGLPHDYARSTRVAPLIRRSLRRTYLVVDTENLYMPFKKHFDVDPAAYGAEGFTPRLRERAVPWLESLCEQHDVDARDVYFVGRKVERIKATVGDLEGNLEPVPKALLAKERSAGKHETDHSDDTVLVGLVAERIGSHPLAHFVLVTSDMDAPQVLRKHGLDRLSVAAPWDVSQKLRDLFAGTGRFTEAGLGERPLVAGRA